MAGINSLNVFNLHKMSTAAQNACLQNIIPIGGGRLGGLIHSNVCWKLYEISRSSQMTNVCHSPLFLGVGRD